MSKPFEYQKLMPFGVEVRLDLSEPLAPATAKALKDIFFEHTLVLFRAQRLTMEAQQRAVGYVGSVIDRASSYVEPNDGVLNSLPLDYHSDLASTPHPNDVVSLYAVEVDEGAAWTGFTSGLRAYQQLPVELREGVDPLMMAMVDTLENKSKATYDAQQDKYNVSRPLVLKHPTTGASILYCSESGTARIEGYSREASDCLLQSLYARIYDRGNELRHYWRTGDLVMWDNLALQHCRPAVAEGTRRKLQRVVAGAGTRLELNPDYKLSAVYQSPESA